MANTENQPEFSIQKIYTKDISFEAPNTPEIFKQDWTPELKLDLQTASLALEAGFYEMVIHVSATVKNKDQVAFIAEVKQAGIFHLKNFPEDQINRVLNVICASIIFPYARETISDMVVRGGFPQLLIAPVNFEMLYAEQQGGAGQAAKANGKVSEKMD
ncbi:MAG: protein-export chaperone SecB [Gammaproteobacteria bacterium]